MDFAETLSRVRTLHATWAPLKAESDDLINAACIAAVQVFRGAWAARWPTVEPGVYCLPDEYGCDPWVITLHFVKPRAGTAWFPQTYFVPGGWGEPDFVSNGAGPRGAHLRPDQSTPFPYADLEDFLTSFVATHKGLDVEIGYASMEGGRSGKWTERQGIEPRKA